jgi:hypothetical protein
MNFLKEKNFILISHPLKELQKNDQKKVSTKEWRKYRVFPIFIVLKKLWTFFLGVGGRGLLFCSSFNCFEIGLKIYGFLTHLQDFWTSHCSKIRLLMDKKEKCL